MLIMALLFLLLIFVSYSKLYLLCVTMCICSWNECIVFQCSWCFRSEHAKFPWLSDIECLLNCHSALHWHCL